MARLELTISNGEVASVTRLLEAELARLPRDSIVSVALRDPEGLPLDHPALRAERLRAAAPPTMTVRAAFGRR